MRLPRRLYDELKTHALQEAPRECCGFIAASWDEALGEHVAFEVIPVTNVAVSGDQTFVTDVIQTRAAFQRIIDLQCGAISYHSHPASAAGLSLRDRRQLWYGCHLVIGLGQGLGMRLWRITPAGHTEEEITVLDTEQCV